MKSKGTSTTNPMAGGSMTAERTLFAHKANKLRPVNACIYFLLISVEETCPPSVSENWA
jgi:hypothetical protein